MFLFLKLQLPNLLQKRYTKRMKNTINNELAVCGFAAVKTLEKINWKRIKRLYFSSEKAPLFGGLCKKMAGEKRPYNQVKDEKELEKASNALALRTGLDLSLIRQDLIWMQINKLNVDNATTILPQDYIKSQRIIEKYL